MDTPIAGGVRKVRIVETVTVAELAMMMALKVNLVQKKLLELGRFVTVNDALDFDTATIVASEFGFESENVGFDISTYLNPEVDVEGDVVHRPPVVTIMGHVDHGKTSLLDRIQRTDIAAGEAGGITQRIGAYTVHTEKGTIIFIDTPGHEAFTAMRARGAMVTDVVVLVVAADDGVMPQTIEAINHAKAAEVPLIVAVNKVDKPESDPARIRRQLADQGLSPEEWGGDTVFVDVSARTGAGVDTLLDMILLQAEINEYKASAKKRARGIIIESRLGEGPWPCCDHHRAGRYPPNWRHRCGRNRLGTCACPGGRPRQVCQRSGAPPTPSRLSASTASRQPARRPTSFPTNARPRLWRTTARRRNATSAWPVSESPASKTS